MVDGVWLMIDHNAKDPVVGLLASTINHLSSAICHLPSAICHLPSAICHLPSAICHLPSAICHLPSAICICHLPSAICHLPSASAICHLLTSGPTILAETRSPSGHPTARVRLVRGDPAVWCDDERNRDGHLIRVVRRENAAAESG